jgi:hypothetical protein
MVFVVSPRAGKISATEIGDLQHELSGGKQYNRIAHNRTAIKNRLQGAQRGNDDELLDLSQIIKV